MHHLAFHFTVNDNPQREILIAHLSSVGFEAFEETDEELIGFISEEKFSENDFNDLMKSLQELFLVSFSKTRIENRNWNEDWERGFKPVIIRDKVCIRASFHPRAKEIEHEIIIDPKMAFGTGHHATTTMMMNLMLEMDFKGKTVLDFGCGTGILSILASRLGAKAITAIDHDKLSIENAEGNFLLNHIKNVDLQHSDRIPSSGNFNIILSNINRNINLAMMKTFNERLLTNGLIIISGFMNQISTLLWKKLSVTSS